MAIAQVQTNVTTGNLTDPREAYEAMSGLVSEAESELGRIHGELDVMVKAWKALTWNDYEFDVDAWHRLMTHAVAQVETLRAHVEEESFNRHLRQTEEERAGKVRKDKIVDTLLNGARAVIGNKPEANKIAEAVNAVTHEEV